MSGKKSEKSNHYYAGPGMIFGGGIGLVFGRTILADVALGFIVAAGIGLVFDSIVGHAKSKNGGN
ncbi:MAG: hypothetical protein P8Q37_06215 [Porticoccaceae bacterium]|nr:hypothetical protein [Porticoccaceae bacterium]MDG1474478.1 hypothetical protein [Porticoccaceae bacterium]